MPRGCPVADTVTPVVSPVRVRYAETDQMGVAYHANYFAWFEVGRTDWLRHRGLTYKSMEAGGYRLPVVDAHCRYRRPARYDDLLEVRTTPRMVSPMRLAFEYELVRPDDALLLATASTTHAVIDTEGRPVPIPEAVLEILK